MRMTSLSVLILIFCVACEFSFPRKVFLAPLTDIEIDTLAIEAVALISAITPPANTVLMIDYKGPGILAREAISGKIAAHGFGLRRGIPARNSLKITIATSISNRVIVLSAATSYATISTTIRRGNVPVVSAMTKITQANYD